MVKFFLIRHGLKEETPGDPPLAPFGKIQAQYTAGFLTGKNIRAVYASPFLRTCQTAEAIGSVLKLPVNTDSRLAERLNWGQRQGESFTDFIAEWVKTDLDRNYVPPEGDSSTGCGRRFFECLVEIENKHRSGNFAVVSHGGAIGDALRQLFPEKHVPHRLDEKHGVKYIHVSECSVTVVSKTGGKFRLELLNDTSHLPEPVA